MKVSSISALRFIERYILISGFLPTKRDETKFVVRLHFYIRIVLFCSAMSLMLALLVALIEYHDDLEIFGKTLTVLCAVSIYMWKIPGYQKHERELQVRKNWGRDINKIWINNKCWGFYMKTKLRINFGKKRKYFSW